MHPTARALLPLMFHRFCKVPMTPWMRFKLFQHCETQDVLYGQIARDAMRDPDPSIRVAGLRWSSYSERRKNILAFRMLDAIGTMHAWVLHRLFRGGCDPNPTHHHARLRVRRWLPSWPINLRNIHGQSLLHFAAQYDSFGLICHFLAHGASPSVRDSKGGTPLHVAARAVYGSTNVEVTIALLQAGARVDARDSKRRTPLHGAVRSNQAEVVHLLLERGANARALDREGRSPRDMISPFDSTGSAEVAQVFSAHDAERRLGRAITSPAQAPIQRSRL